MASRTRNPDWEEDLELKDDFKLFVQRNLSHFLSLISPWKRKGEKKGKKSCYNKGYSYLVTHLSTVSGEQDLTLLSRRKVLVSVAFLVVY